MLIAFWPSLEVAAAELRRERHDEHYPHADHDQRGQLHELVFHDEATPSGHYCRRLSSSRNRAAASYSSLATACSNFS